MSGLIEGAKTNHICPDQVCLLVKNGQVNHAKFLQPDTRIGLGANEIVFAVSSLLVMQHFLYNS